MSLPCEYVFVLPTLKMAGGNLEVLRLARELRGQGKDVAIMSMWGTQNTLPCDDIPCFTLFDEPVGRWCALFSLPLVFLAFREVGKQLRNRSTRFIFTHYATYLLTPLVRKRRRWFFVQALEWHFVAAGPLRRTLKAFIIATYRRGRLLTANSFLRRSLEKCGLRIEATADIWADPFFQSAGGDRREYDVAMIFRKGAPKRADWGVALLERLQAERPRARVIVISPDEDFAEVAGSGATFLLRPSRAEIRETYQRSRVFVLFSDHEGFGLPPLEAMGCGCVPLCRDAGGIRAYMEPFLEENIIPLDAPPEAMVDRLLTILDKPNEWSRLSAASRRAFHLGLDRAADRLTALIRCGFIGEDSGAR